MNAQDFRSLQEAYLEVVEGAAGDVAKRAQKLANQKKEQTPERKKMYQDLAYKAGSRERDGSGSPRTSRFERSKEHGPDITPMVSQSRSSQETLGGGTYERGPKRLPKSKEKYRRQVATGVRAASSQEKKRLGIKEDIYDIILSHLIDEGYAETPEAAEAIMVNMSEGWREDIMEISDRKVDAVGRRRQANVDKAMSSDEYIFDKPGATQKLATEISKKTRFNYLNKKRERRRG
jgi:hypothetical protein